MTEFGKSLSKSDWCTSVAPSKITADSNIVDSFKQLLPGTSFLSMVPVGMSDVLVLSVGLTANEPLLSTQLTRRSYGRQARLGLPDGETEKKGTADSKPPSGPRIKPKASAPWLQSNDGSNNRSMHRDRYLLILR